MNNSSPNPAGLTSSVASIEDIRRALISVNPASFSDVLIGENIRLTVRTADLATALGVTLPIVVYIGYVTVHNLHLRTTPTVSGTLLHDLPFGTAVSVLSTPPQMQDNLNWLQVRLADGTQGFCAGDYLSRTAPAAPVNPPAASPSTPAVISAASGKHKAGLHVLQDGVSALLNFATAAKQAGGVIPSATIINDQMMATHLANGLIGRVIFRYTPDGATETVTLPADEAGAIAAGRQWVAAKFAWPGWAGLRGDNIYVQVVNEIPYGPMHYAYWLGVMQELEARGHKAAIGGYAVGGPEPDQWAILVPALRYAAQHGHIVVLHAYCAPNTAPGLLSANGNSEYYETRFLRLYSAVPADCRPPLILSEFGGEFSRGKFQGTDALLSLCAAFETAVSAADYLISYNLWTMGSIGGWGDASIDNALTSLSHWIGK